MCCYYLIELKNLKSSVGKLCWAVAHRQLCITLAKIHSGRKKHNFFTRFSMFPAPFLSFFGSCIIPVCSVAAWPGTMAVLTQLENCLPCLAVSAPPICWLQRVIGALIDAASRGCVLNVGDTACNGMVLLLR